MVAEDDSIGRNSPTRFASSDLATFGQALKEAGYQIRQISFSYENATRANIETDIIKIEQFVTALIASWAALKGFIQTQIEKLEPNETPSGRDIWPVLYLNSKSNTKPELGLSKKEADALGVGSKKLGINNL